MCPSSIHMSWDSAMAAERVAPSGAPRSAEHQETVPATVTSFPAYVTGKVSHLLWRWDLEVMNKNGSAEFQISTNHTFTVSPEFIGSRFLLKMRKTAEQHLQVSVQKVVISVPAEFDERQRNSTIRTAKLAGC
ncbi:heat shock 70 kDa protein 13-like [Gouania willdenowi]|uniref:heat shock 70 kDa protein 13-like n=1 Tax=Gouania willdenowi TaxID=441366 RepID=UPI0010563A12|nr:heat shock 70 kDa protein 13-like [Gouania willdenowi]